MPPESAKCESAVYSEDYVDYIIEYNPRRDNIKQDIERYCIQYINEVQAVLYVPEDNREFLVSNRGYSALPKCYGLLDTEVLQNTGIARLRRQPFFNLYGRGVLIAIIDTGIDYRHPAFVKADNTTKIVAAWNQNDRTGPKPEGISYGTEYSGEDINGALNNGETGPESLIAGSEHGTGIAAIAAGMENEENGFSGMAPDAELVIVKLKEAKKIYKEYYRIPDDARIFQENDIMMGITYALGISKREGKPLVICLGTGTNQGDHNGTGQLSAYLNLLAVNPGIFVCVAAGNETAKAHHYRSGLLDYGEYEDVEMYVGSNSSGFTAEIWGNARSLFAIQIKPPAGDFSGLIDARFEENRTINFSLNDSLVEISVEIIERGSGDELIFIRFVNPNEGLWSVRVILQNEQPGIFDMWLPMDNMLSSETEFLEPSSDVSICEPGNTAGVITFGGSTVSGRSLYVNSSRGFTRSGSVKPDVTAPAVNVYTASVNNAYTEVTGTSIAAGIGAGSVALIAEWSVRNNPVNSIAAKKYLIRGADREGIEVPDKGWGWGRLDLYNSFTGIEG